MKINASMTSVVIPGIVAGVMPGAVIPWTGRRMAVAKFIPHLRNEHALHRWDIALAPRGEQLRVTTPVLRDGIVDRADQQAALRILGQRGEDAELLVERLEPQDRLVRAAEAIAQHRFDAEARIGTRRAPGIARQRQRRPPAGHGIERWRREVRGGLSLRQCAAAVGGAGILASST